MLENLVARLSTDCAASGAVKKTNAAVEAVKNKKRRSMTARPPPSFLDRRSCRLTAIFQLIQSSSQDREPHAAAVGAPLPELVPRDCRACLAGSPAPSPAR